MDNKNIKIERGEQVIQKREEIFYKDDADITSNMTKKEKIDYQDFIYKMSCINYNEKLLKELNEEKSWITIMSTKAHIQSLRDKLKNNIFYQEWLINNSR